MSVLTDRMIRAARLDANLYEEVEADRGTMGQATTVVALASVAAGIGSFAEGGVGGFLIVTLGTLLGWYIWAYMTYLIGTRLLPEPQTQADFGELLRTIGFSSSPGVLRVLAIVPGLNHIVFLICGVWMLVAMVVAVRQALDYTGTGRALAVCAIGWLVQIGLLMLLFLVAGAPHQ